MFWFFHPWSHFPSMINNKCIFCELPVRPFLNKSVLVLTCSTVARSDLSFTLYLQRAANQNVSHTNDITHNVNSTELSSHVRVCFFLFLHRRHFIDHRVGVIQLVWNQNQQPDFIFIIMNWFTDSLNRSNNLHSGSTSFMIVTIAWTTSCKTVNWLCSYIWM